MSFLRVISEADEARARRRYHSYRNVLILAYVGLFITAFAGFVSARGSAGGFTIFALYFAGGMVLLLIPVAYLASLVVAELLFRLRLPVWVVCVVSAVLAPAMIVLLVRFW